MSTVWCCPSCQRPLAGRGCVSRDNILYCDDHCARSAQSDPWCPRGTVREIRFSPSHTCDGCGVAMVAGEPEMCTRCAAATALVDSFQGIGQLPHKCPSCDRQTYEEHCIACQHGLDAAVLKATNLELRNELADVRRGHQAQADEFLKAHTRAIGLADEAGNLRHERDELLRENATLRRKLERLERKVPR